jgi:hypothetical protein
MNLNWPKKGDRGFAPAGDLHDIRQLNAFVTVSQMTYAVGFKDAADKVVEAALKDNCHPDLLLAPVAYLYRHYLELTLKYIVSIGVGTGTTPSAEACLKKHDLKTLWTYTRQIIEAVLPGSNRADTDAVESVVMEFHRMDTSGQAFRYAADSTGRKHLEAMPEFVSLMRLRNTMDGVANFLGGAVDGVDACDPG